MAKALPKAQGLTPNPQSAQSFFANQIPSDLNGNPGLQTLAQQYASAYAGHSPNYHPIRNAIVAGMLGGPLMGLPMAILGYGSGQRQDSAYRAGLAAQFPEDVKNQIANMQAAQNYQKPLNDSDLVGSQINDMIANNQLNPHTIKPQAGKAYSTEVLNNFYNTAITPAALNPLNDAINNQQQQSFGLPQQQSPGKLLTTMQQQMGTPTFTLQANKQGSPYSADNAANLPMAMTPDVFGHIASAQQAAATNGLTEGEKRYEFGVMSPSEIAKNQGAANESNANAAYTRGPKSFETTQLGKAYQRGPGIGSYPPNAPQPNEQTLLQSLFSPQELKGLMQNKLQASAISPLVTALGATYVPDPGVPGGYRPPKPGEPTYAAYQNGQTMIQGVLNNMRPTGSTSAAPAGRPGAPKLSPQAQAVVNKYTGAGLTK